MKKFAILLFLMAPVAALAGYGAFTDTIGKKRVKNLDTLQLGIASYYHSKFHGRPTASGQLYDETLMTGAHNSLPFNTWVKVTYLKNGKSVIIKINDRLHYKNTRLVDLSRAAAAKLGIIAAGLAKVRLEILKNPPE